MPDQQPAAGRGAARSPTDEAHELAAAALEHGVDPLAGDVLDVAVPARLEPDVEVVGERRAHEVAARELQRRDRLGVPVAPPAVAELRAVDLHEHGVDGPVAGALRGGARRLHVAHDDHRERDDEPEEDQAPIHATDCTPRIAAMSEPTKYLLGEEQIPTHWINLLR